uniref:MAK10-like protein n=1 Tax=Tanacetum cinerariifolium TaxID=118510 RepID=A0A699GRJ5_TANCI|nr:MAK10-like protein [Tanacetum cinerariifolium]
MEAHLAPKQHIQRNKITSLCEICSGPYDTQYYMENPKQAFVDYASSRTDEAGGTRLLLYVRSAVVPTTLSTTWKIPSKLLSIMHPHVPTKREPNDSFSNRSFDNNPQRFNNQSNLEGLVSNFMASQDARLSKFEADFKQQQSKMTNKIDTVLKAITDRITGALPSDTVKNSKLNVNSTSPVLSARSCPTEDLQCSTQIHSSINTITICPRQPNKSLLNKPEEERKNKEGSTESINTIELEEGPKDIPQLEPKDPSATKK